MAKPKRVNTPEARRYRCLGAGRPSPEKGKSLLREKGKRGFYRGLKSGQMTCAHLVAGPTSYEPLEIRPKPQSPLGLLPMGGRSTSTNTFVFAASQFFATQEQPPGCGNQIRAAPSSSSGTLLACSFTATSSDDLHRSECCCLSIEGLLL